MMKKSILAAVLVAAMAALTGCAAKTVDIKGLAANLVSEGSFSEQLTEVSADITAKRYGLDNQILEDCVSYGGTKAVVDEVAIFKTSDTEAVREQVEEHIETQTASYSSYRPDEVPKLQSCVIQTIGDCVILCVSNDSDTAQKIIDEYK